MASETPTKPSEQHSTSELLSSAKLLAEAARSAGRSESDKVDKAKVADAAGNLLDAASRYGKLDDHEGIGQYVDKASDYLHQHGTTAPSKPSTTAPSDPSPKPESQGEGGGLGQFAKMAGGFLK